MRLDKFLAEASIGTRKVVRNYIFDKKITVNNQYILNPAEEIDESLDEVRYCGNKVIKHGKRYYMFHKPAGCITARVDEKCKTIFDYIKVDHMEGLFPVGRLDKDTEGLILITNDGEFNHSLMYPDKKIEKTYYFWALGSLNAEGKERLLTGLSIGDESALVRAVKIEVVKEGYYYELRDIMNLTDKNDIKINPYHQPVVSGSITITEGRKHQVKRMLKAVGCYVVYLKRISIGGLTLDETLEKGQFRELTEYEIIKALN